MTHIVHNKQQIMSPSAAATIMCWKWHIGKLFPADQTESDSSIGDPATQSASEWPFDIITHITKFIFSRP